MGFPTATHGSQSFTTPAGMGASASMPVVGAAVIGFAVWGKKKRMASGQKKRAPSLKAGGDNML